jgi:hypothetical protein
MCVSFSASKLGVNLDKTLYIAFKAKSESENLKIGTTVIRRLHLGSIINEEVRWVYS